MSNSIKKLLAAVLALALTVSMVACGTATVIPDETVAKDGEQENAGVNADQEVGEVSYPLQTDHTISIWCPSTTAPIYKTYEDYTQSPWHSGLVEKTGVNVEWKFPVAGADDQQAYNLLLTEEELPDIICWGIDAGNGQLLYDEGAIVDLTEYLPKYAPDYWKYINAEGREEYLRSVTTEDGQIYMVRLFTENEYNSVAYGPVVRKDWLDACGLDIPVTIADWEEMLIAFRDTYGAKFTFPKARFATAGLASGFGAQGSLYCRYYLEDGEVKFSAVQPEFREYLGTLARWVEEGLMDEDSLTMSDEGFRTKALNGDCGAAFTVMSLFTKMISDAEAEMTGAEWIAVPYPVVEEGQPTEWINYTSNIYNNGCVITTSCPEEEIATALRWLNYAYTDEGLMYYNYGIENDTYIINDAGEIEFTEKMTGDRDGVAAACYKYTGMGNVATCGVQLSRFVYVKNDPVVAEGVYTWIGDTKAAEHLVPTLTLTSEENSRHTDLYMAFATYSNEMTMKIIAGEMDIAEYDAVIQQIYNLGLEEALAIQNAAYQRYLAQ